MLFCANATRSYINSVSASVSRRVSASVSRNFLETAYFLSFSISHIYTGEMPSASASHAAGMSRTFRLATINSPNVKSSPPPITPLSFLNPKSRRL